MRASWLPWASNSLPIWDVGLEENFMGFKLKIFQNGLIQYRFHPYSHIFYLWNKTRTSSCIDLRKDWDQV